MIFANPHPPLIKKNRHPRHSSLFNLVHNGDKMAKGNNADRQYPEENNYLSKSQHRQFNLKEECIPFPIERKMFCPKRIRLHQQKRQISKIFSDNNKIIGEIRLVKPLNSKKSPTQRDKPNHILKNYFKHLNLHANNNSSFVGASILLHKREGKQQPKNRQLHSSMKSYRNGFPPLNMHSSLKQLSSDPASACGIRYESTQTERVKATISPWEGAEETEIVHTPPESLKRMVKLARS